MTNLSPLDNPTWHALTAGQRALGRSHGLAGRYPSDVSPLAGLAEPTPRAFAGYGSPGGKGPERSPLGEAQPPVPAEWEVGATSLDQSDDLSRPAGAITVADRHLLANDIPEMLALTALAQPGPFLPRTILIGHYFGFAMKPAGWWRWPASGYASTISSRSAPSAPTPTFAAAAMAKP